MTEKLDQRQFDELVASGAKPRQKVMPPKAPPKPKPPEPMDKVAAAMSNVVQAMEMTNAMQKSMMEQLVQIVSQTPQPRITGLKIIRSMEHGVPLIDDIEFKTEEL